MASATVNYDSSRYAKVNRFDPHHWRRVRSAFGDLAGMRLLEVGSGRGLLLRRLQHAGADAFGIDANPEAARASVAANSLTGRAHDLPFADASFDGIVSVHTIEHLPMLDDALAEMVRVVRPGGRILLIYPAEPVRGLWAVPTAIILHRDPLMARKVHCFRLTPKRLRRRMHRLPVAEIRSDFSLWRWPQYSSVFDRLH
ncbi:MAG: class I SAM-dependent methyltransferase [Nitriliruptoraceae bacterium]